MASYRIRIKMFFFNAFVINLQVKPMITENCSFLETENSVSYAAVHENISIPKVNDVSTSFETKATVKSKFGTFFLTFQKTKIEKSFYKTFIELIKSKTYKWKSDY